MQIQLGWLRRAVAAIAAFLSPPFRDLAAAARWMWRKFLRVLVRCYEWLRRALLFLARPALIRNVAITLLALIVLYCGTFYWLERQVPKPLPVDKFVFLDQGWGLSGTSDDRLKFYYSPQGAYVKNVRYDWFVNLERPWKTDRFRELQYMRGYGFIVDRQSTDKNPDNLPIGFAKSWDPRSASDMLDLTCAACHTGELQVVKNNQRIAVRIDGGQAMHAITSTKPGSFGLDLMASLVSTELNPFKWSRFADNVLHDQNTLREDLRLRMDVAKVIFDLTRQTLVEKRRHLYPGEEGFGRTDALGRIANNVFATNLNSSNYRVANAPVSYPPLWDIWKFDWVQYTGSVAQPMARNIGQSLGTGAQYDLVDEYGRPIDTAVDFHTSAKIASMVKIEETLRTLKPPVWDERLFGPRNDQRYLEGKKLFKSLCYHCHGVVYASDSQRAMEAPLKAKKDHWRLRILPVQTIGTDPTSAFNFFRNRYNLASMGLNPDELRATLGEYYRERFLRKQQFDEEHHAAFTCKDVKDAEAAERETTTLDPAKSGRKNQPPVTTQEIPGDDQTSDDRKAMHAAVAEACSSHGATKAEDVYAYQQLSSMDLSSVSSGEGLNYMIALIRRRAYIDMDVKDDGSCDAALKQLNDPANQAGSKLQEMTYAERQEALPVACRREELDGFGQLDTPRVKAVYRARPLEGIWATAPFLHNGSVPNLYEMLLPANQRSKTFYVKGRTFDPVLVGLLTDPGDPQAFLFDTTKTGNSNSGHEFRAGYTGQPADGVIGPELTDEQRWSIIEYLKFMKNDDFCKQDVSQCMPSAPPAQAANPNK
jgi:cytochrome c5